MAAEALLVDTDVLIDHLRGVQRFDPGERSVSYSSITRAELFAGPEQQLDAVRSLLGPFNQIPVDGPIAEIGGALRRAVAIPLPDALIAATAVRGGLAVMTRNRRHFELVDGLVVRSPPG